MQGYLTRYDNSSPLIALNPMRVQQRYAAVLLPQYGNAHDGTVYCCCNPLNYSCNTSTHPQTTSHVPDCPTGRCTMGWTQQAAACCCSSWLLQPTASVNDTRTSLAFRHCPEPAVTQSAGSNSSCSAVAYGVCFSPLLQTTTAAGTSLALQHYCLGQLASPARCCCGSCCTPPHATLTGMLKT